MTEIFGFIGFLVCIAIALPASLSAMIKVFSQPAAEIVTLWVTLIDQVLDIVDSIKKQFGK